MDKKNAKPIGYKTQKKKVQKSPCWTKRQCNDLWDEAAVAEKNANENVSNQNMACLSEPRLMGPPLPFYRCNIWGSGVILWCHLLESLLVLGVWEVVWMHIARVSDAVFPGCFWHWI